MSPYRRDGRRPRAGEREGGALSFGIMSLIILVIVAIVLIPILMRVIGEAGRRNPNRPEDEGDEGAGKDPSRQSGPGRE
jgi:predicted metalloprotease